MGTDANVRPSPHFFRGRFPKVPRRLSKKYRGPFPCPRSAGQRPVTTLIAPDRCPVPQRVVASPGPMNSMRLI